MSAGESIASSSQAINVGPELKQALERAAREEGFDATGLARRVLQEYLAERNREGAASSARLVELKPPEPLLGLGRKVPLN